MIFAGTSGAPDYAANEATMRSDDWPQEKRTCLLAITTDEALKSSRKVMDTPDASTRCWMTTELCIEQTFGIADNNQSASFYK